MPIPLRILLGDHPATRALRRGVLSSPLLPLEFADVTVPNRALKRVVRDLEFDVAEIALMTFLMARSRGVPLKLLPIVVCSRNPLPHLVADRDRRHVTPPMLASCRIGVHSYTTTTAVWIRRILADQCQVPLRMGEWVTLEEEHVAGVADPSNVRRLTSPADLLTLLRDGAVDAAILDPVPGDARFGPVVTDPDQVYAAWRTRHGGSALNHVIVVTEALAADAAAIGELFRLFRDSGQLAGPSHDPDSTPLGLAANRRNLEVAIEVAAAEGLLARPLTVEELIPKSAAAL